LFSQKEIIFANIILLFVSPYYRVNNGISQVNNYGRIQPKTGVKKKNTLLLYKYNKYYITKSSTSFHLGGLWGTIVAPESLLKGTNWWRQESEISGINLENG